MKFCLFVGGHYHAYECSSRTAFAYLDESLPNLKCSVASSCMAICFQLSWSVCRARFICLYRFTLLIELWNMVLLLRIVGHCSRSSIQLWHNWMAISPCGTIWIIQWVIIPCLCRDILWKTDYWPLIVGECLPHTLLGSSCCVCFFFFLGC